MEQKSAEMYCAMTMPVPKLTEQCNPEDLTQIAPNKAIDHHTLWIRNRGICINGKCEALVFNSTHDEAATSIKCINCDALHGVVCDQGSEPCKSPGISVTAGHSTSCSNTWISIGDKEFFISTVRRTMQDSEEWCRLNNGTAIERLHELKGLQSMVLPNPVFKTYWIAVSIKDYNKGNIGAVLTTKQRGTSLTPKFNTAIVPLSEFHHSYGCLCIRKVKVKQSMTSTSSTTKSTTTTSTKNVFTPPPIHTQPGEMFTGRYKNIQKYNKLMKRRGDATEISARMSSECAMKCDRTSACKAYFFDKNTSSCQLLDADIRPEEDFDDVPNAKYFQKQ